MPSKYIIAFIHTPHPTTFSIFHLLPLFVIIIFLHSFLSISSVVSHHFSKIFAILSPSSSTHSFHQLPFKMSFPQSPHLIHFIFFLQNILQKICVIKKQIELSKNDLSMSRTKNRTATTSLSSFVSSVSSYMLIGVVLLVGCYLQYIKRYTYIISITYKGINVIIIVWL